MKKINGAILFRCGDSRNGGMYKAVKKHFGWLQSCRIKTLALAGGGHTKKTPSQVIEEVAIYTKALKNKGASSMALIITDHEDCGFVSLVGPKNLEARWLNQKFTDKLFREVPELNSVYLMHVGYVARNRPTVPSSQVKLTELGCVERVN